MVYQINIVFYQNEIILKSILKISTKLAIRTKLFNWFYLAFSYFNVLYIIPKTGATNIANASRFTVALLELLQGVYSILWQDVFPRKKISELIYSIYQ